jgi:hypothetical protein
MSKDSTPSEASPAYALAEACCVNFATYDQIARLAELAASYWKSTALAADRGDAPTVVTHCRQVALVTRDVFALVKSLGGEVANSPP